MHGSSDEIKKEQSSQAKLLQDLNEKVMKIEAEAAVLQQNLVDLRARSMRCNLLFYASVNSTGAHPPPPPPGNPGAFPHVVSPGGGAFVI